jgi:polysaccharide deacetylase 2 family uncharacterized protein YibQ
MGHLIRRHARELGFAVLAMAALVFGGGAALDGLSGFARALTPGMTAQAAGSPAADTVRLALPGFADSGRAPQVLYPVIANARPGWLGQPAAPVAAPVVAICIDDLGEDLSGTEAAMRLPRAVALSFLPFAAMTPGFAARAREEGHTVLAHVPMEALRGGNPGPMALLLGMGADEIARRLNWSLERVPGAVGVNNHEGSRFTSDAQALAPVMAILKARGLFFFDSRTSGGSKGEAAARAAGVETIGRDIFLDDDRNEAAVKAQLNALAATARKRGVAVAIGHPHAATLRLVKEWLGEDHGVRLVTLEEAMRARAAMASR